MEKLLCWMAMDRACLNGCSELSIKKFGKNCDYSCANNAKKMLSENERLLILFSMIFVVEKVENFNIDPDVRTHLWLRASGAAQFIDCNEGYQIEGDHAA